MQTRPAAFAFAFVSALALSAFIFAVMALLVRAGATFLVGPVVWCGLPGGFLLAQLPAAVLEAVFPGGGGLGFMGLALAGAFLQSVVLLTALLYLRRSRRRSAGG